MVIWDIEVFSTDLLVISKLIEMTKLSLKAKNLTLMTKVLFIYLFIFTMIVFVII